VFEPASAKAGLYKQTLINFRLCALVSQVVVSNNEPLA